MEIKIGSDTLKSPLGIILAVIVIAGALGFMHWRRSTLIEQGSVEVAEYLRTELPARYVRENDGRPPDVERIEKLGQVEVLSFSPSWFFRADRDKKVRVKTVVRIGTGESATFYFRFKRTLGAWRIEREISQPLLDAFR